MASEQTYPLNINYLPNEYREKAKKELKELHESCCRLLEELKAMAKNEEETRDIEFHDDFLMTLPWRCREGCTITLFEYCKWSPSGISVEDLNRLGLILYHQALRNPLAQINGFKMIVDWKGANFEQLRHTPPRSLWMAYKSFEACTPARNKEIHFVNNSAIWTIIWALIKPFLTEKVKRRIIYHSSPEDLLKYFPKHALPAQYGGDLEDYYMEDWMKDANEQQSISTLAGQCNHF